VDENRVVTTETPGEWTDVAVPWREAFEQAWEAFLAGSPAVGAVVTGADGAVVSRGRSRRAERSAPPGQLAGSRVAHAELNALAGLPLHAGPDVILYTTLEPCFLCAAATAMSRVPRLRFAGRDPVWQFVQHIGDVDPVLRERWYEQEGPLPGPIGAWASLLPLVDRLQRNPTGGRVDAFRANAPALWDLAHDLITTGGLAELATGSLDAALASLWPDLVAASDTTA
jgi:tRNA(adenine34) deaminase